MQLQSNYQHLLLIRADIEKQTHTSPCFIVFNQKKVKEFFQQNNMRLKIADEKKAELVIRFVKHDEKNEPVVLENNNGFVKYDFTDAEAAEEFNNEYKAFMSKDIIIHC